MGHTIKLGEPTVITSVVPPHELVFEDDGETGYLYVLELDHVEDEQPIIDALLIYTVGEERGDTHEVEILWNETRHTAILFIDDLAQALVDFAEPRFMCRTGFPAPAPSAPVTTHEWDESAWQSHV